MRKTQKRARHRTHLRREKICQPASPAATQQKRLLSGRKRSYPIWKQPDTPQRERFYSRRAPIIYRHLLTDRKYVHTDVSISNSHMQIDTVTAVVGRLIIPDAACADFLSVLPVGPLPVGENLRWAGLSRRRSHQRNTRPAVLHSPTDTVVDAVRLVPTPSGNASYLTETTTRALTILLQGR